MVSHLILSVLVAGATSTATTAKVYLQSDPLLAGSLIKYCEKEAPKSCATIDRRKEAIDDEKKVLTEVPLKLAEIYSEFDSLSVTFPKSAKVSAGFDLTFNSKLGTK
ncbi:MAG TPA: hypothetical protein V6C65_00275 [Allocoleopsis sp.]